MYASELKKKSMAEDDLLTCLLDVAEAELNSLNEVDRNSKELQENFSCKTFQKKNSLSEIDIFSTNRDENNLLTPRRKKKYEKIEKDLSFIHDGDNDSSDEEGKRNFENSKYDDYGTEIKNLLNNSRESQLNNKPLFPQASNGSGRWTAAKPKVNAPTPSKSLLINKPLTNIYTDPIFGISIINPNISSKLLEERMKGRKAVPICQIDKYIKTLKKDDDWVIAGVVCSKGLTKTSSKGNQFTIWTLSDLLGDIKTIALFLFGSAYKEFWKTQPGSVVGILNPSILDKKEGSRDEATLSVDNSQKIMILGQSKDLGTCKSIKKNGEKCTSIVNKNKCEFCIYHIKQEYQKCSIRSDLQSNFSGKGLIALRNKVLGKNEVFYAGKSYTAIPAKKSKKLIQKDQNRLHSLSNSNVNNPIKKKNINKRAAESFDIARNQRMKDLETLKKLGVNSVKCNETKSFTASHSSEVTLNESKANAVKILAKLNAGVKEKNQFSERKLSKDKNISEKADSQSKLSSEIEDQNSSKYSIKNSADIEKKLKTIDEIKERGKTIPHPIEPEENSEQLPAPKSDAITTSIFSNALIMSSTPSLCKDETLIDLNEPFISRRAKKAKDNVLKFIQKNGPLKKADPNSLKGKGIKRNLEFDNDETTKKLKMIQENEFLSDRFKKMMELQSKHKDLVDIRDDEEKEKYFKKLEIKEKMEEKMSTTYKINCKAVRCLTCKYTNFSAADRCKAEKHRLRVFDAVKRFFKCGHCGNRVACLDVVPIHPCKNCGNGNWERTTMMKDKNVTNTVALSIRGGEQAFINSVVTDANINLLVPEEC